jgi:hypothetical protein
VPDQAVVLNITALTHDRQAVKVFPSRTSPYTLAPQTVPFPSMDLLATGTSINASQGAITTATSMRVAPMSVAAYEYAVKCISLSVVVTHVLPAISLPSLWNIGCTTLL